MFPGTARTEKELATKLDQWDQALVEYGVKYSPKDGKVDFTSSIKHTIISSIIPQELLQTRYKGKHLNSYETLRNEVDAYLVEVIVERCCLIGAYGYSATRWLASRACDSCSGFASARRL